ncbi:L,D-transpeptidase [Pararhizobium sp. YC-54]|uniref:L,D-transpeptidase n=1 Tax=Pararhizobium sp. YC-54 TaxID=2986920 RepID=UPI0021F7739F|nr:L,D-transpeptidase [Pararhizobium sp. YC-54]MCW0000970.1 L,D-transpeptidase [Pararhizobium sp. YC-54]
MTSRQGSNGQEAQHGKSAGRVLRGILVALSFGLAAFSTQTVASGLVPRNLGPATGAMVTTAQNYAAGTIVIVSKDRTLDLVVSGNRAIRYRIGVGRDGFRWSGVVKVGHKAEWPDWRPPSEMRARAPDLPELVPAGPFNPLGARGIYLYRGNADTLYRIHGTNDQSTVGGFASSGCFRMSNADVIDLYSRVKVGATVIVK